MRLMLTSAGVKNELLKEALKEMVKEDIRIAFIPTAANMEGGNKDWLIDNLNECKELGEVDIVDISAMDKKEWLPRLEKANVIVVGGGWTAYLMDCIKKSGLIEQLENLLETRVYVGISAGSIALAKTIFACSEFIYSDEDGKSHPGLGYVDFNFRPHLYSDEFPKVRDENLKEISHKLDGDLYAMDDESGIVCIGGEIEIVSEGKWIKYSNDAQAWKGSFKKEIFDNVLWELLSI